MAAKKGHKGKKVRAGAVLQGRKKLTVVAISCRAQNLTKVIKGLKLTMASRVPEKEVIWRWEVSKGQRLSMGSGVDFQKSDLRALAGQETHQAALLSPSIIFCLLKIVNPAFPPSRVGFLSLSKGANG